MIPIWFLLVVGLIFCFFLGWSIHDIVQDVKAKNFLRLCLIDTREASEKDFLIGSIINRHPPDWLHTRLINHPLGDRVLDGLLQQSCEGRVRYLKAALYK